jgi:hypothetical protein
MTAQKNREKILLDINDEDEKWSTANPNEVLHTFNHGLVVTLSQCVNVLE